MDLLPTDKKREVKKLLDDRKNKPITNYRVKKDGPDSMVNMTCANNNSCMTNGIMRQAPRK